MIPLKKSASTATIKHPTRLSIPTPRKGNKIQIPVSGLPPIILPTTQLSLNYRFIHTARKEHPKKQHTCLWDLGKRSGVFFGFDLLVIFSLLLEQVERKREGDTPPRVSGYGGNRLGLFIWSIDCFGWPSVWGSPVPASWGVVLSISVYAGVKSFESCVCCLCLCSKAWKSGLSFCAFRLSASLHFALLVIQGLGSEYVLSRGQYTILVSLG
jgi:hypothetical protein